MELSSSNIFPRSRLIQVVKTLPLSGYLDIAQTFLVPEIVRLYLQKDNGITFLLHSAVKTSSGIYTIPVAAYIKVKAKGYRPGLDKLF